MLKKYRDQIKRSSACQSVAGESVRAADMCWPVRLVLDYNSARVWGLIPLHVIHTAGVLC